MQKSIFFGGIVASLVLSGCNHEKNNEDAASEILEFSLQRDDRLNFVDSLNVKFIQLEETDESLIKTVGQIQQCGDRLLISDSEHYNLHVYGMDGKYMGNIGSRGQAGGEYIMLSSFFVEDDDKNVCLWDGESRRLLTFSLSDYSFIGECQLPDISSECCVPIDSCLIWYNDGYDRGDTDYFIVTDRKGVKQDAFVKKHFKSGYITGSSYPLFKSGGVVKGYTPYNMTLYSMDNDGVVGSLDISIEGFNMPSKAFMDDISKNGSSMSLFSNLSDSEFISYYDVMETDALIGLTIIKHHEMYVGLADKYSGSTYFDTQDHLAERLRIGRILYFVPNSIDDGLLAIVDKDEMQSSNMNNIRPELKEMISNDNSNPIIAVISRK